MLPLLATSLALAALTQAAPAQNGFTVNQVASGHKKMRHGAKSMVETFHKFNKTVPAHVLAAAQSPGTVTASPQKYDEEYLCPVSIGSQPVTLMMDFDTGSSDLWVFSTEMPAAQQKGHTLYNPGASSSAQLESGETWKIAYGDGSGAAGNIYADKVVIGGVTATSQAVEAATSASSSFVSNTASNGLVGLAFDNINTASPSKVQTFMGNVGPTLPSNLFAATLKHNAPGTYDFGSIIASRYTGSITYVPVSTTNGFWQFTTSGYAVGSTTYGASYTAIADTGTTLIYLPNAVINNYYSQVKGAQNSQSAGGVIFPCTSTLPNLSVSIGGVQHTVPGSYINFAPYASGYCFGGLQSSSGLGINILGDVFLKSQYVVFDLGNTRIGFAAQA